eukprot:400515_1
MAYHSNQNNDADPFAWLNDPLGTQQKQTKNKKQTKNLGPTINQLQKKQSPQQVQQNINFNDSGWNNNGWDDNFFNDMNTTNNRDSWADPFKESTQQTIQQQPPQPSQSNAPLDLNLLFGDEPEQKTDSKNTIIDELFNLGYGSKKEITTTTTELPSDSVPFDRINSNDIDTFLNEIDENEKKQQEKQNECYVHWWNNFRFVHGTNWGAHVSEALKDETLGLTKSQHREIRDKLAKSTAAAWEVCSTEFKPDIRNKFEKWYKKLMHEKRLIISDMNQIKIKALCCFQWRIPRYGAKDVQLLVTRYYKKTMKNVVMSLDVIQIIINYFGAFRNQKTLEYWKNFDGEHENFRSAIFSFGSLQFCFLISKRFHNYCGGDNDCGGVDCNVDTCSKHKITYNLSIEFIGAPKNMFYKSYIRLSCMYVEKGYKSCYDFEIKSKEYDNKIELFERITVDDIDDMIESGKATFNLYFHDIALGDWIGRSVEYSDDENGVQLFSPFIVGESMITSENTAVLNWKWSADEIKKGIKVAESNIKGNSVYIKSQIFDTGYFKCNMNARIEPPITENNCTTSGETKFNISLFGLRSQIDYLHFWYSVKFNGETRYIDKPRAIITNGENNVVNVEYSTGPLVESMKNNNSASFQFYIHLLDMFDCNNNKIIFDQFRCSKSISMSVVQSVNYKPFKWEICDRKLLKKMKKCKSVDNFFSPLFKVDSCIFMLEVIPRKKEFSFDEERFYCAVVLHLVKIPYDLHITQLTIIKSDDKFSNNLIFHCGNVSENSFSCAKPMNSKSFKKLDSVTFCSDIKILHAMDRNSNDITDAIINYDEKQEQKQMDKLISNYCEWKIPKKYYKEDVEGGMQICSNIFELFGCQWLIIFVPKEEKGDDRMHLYLYRADINPNIPFIAVHCKFVIKEMDLMFSLSKRFDINHKIGTRIEYEYFIEIKQIKNKKRLTFGFEMTLINCYDKNEMNVTDQYNFCKIDKIETLNIMNDSKSKYLQGERAQNYELQWKIKSKYLQMERAQSPIFPVKDLETQFPDLQFAMLFYPLDRESDKSVLYFGSITELPNNVEKLCLMVTIQIKKLNVIMNGVVHIKNDDLIPLLSSWIKLEINRDEPITLDIKVQVIDIVEKEKLK